MNRIENTGQIKTGYSVKSGTNSEEKVGNGSDFASMLKKYKKKAAQDDETKKAETGETKNKETQPEETKNRENEKQVNGGQARRIGHEYRPVPRMRRKGLLEGFCVRGEKNTS